MKLSEAFSHLGSRPRRILLVMLCDIDSVDVSQGLLTRSAVAAPASSNGSVDRVSTEQIELIHNHLPKLAAANLIEWDREAERVSRGPEFSEIEEMVHLLATNQHALPGPFY